MGQQQLLLLVLGIVIVGGTVVAGAHAFKGEKQEENRGLIYQDALVIVHDLQIWKMKPMAVGGGANLQGFDKVSFRSIGYPHMILSKRVYKTENACYQLKTVGEAHHAHLTISAPSCSEKDYAAHVVVRGVLPGDVDWQHTPPLDLTTPEKMGLGK